jgi:hypothetical protein
LVRAPVTRWWPEQHVPTLQFFEQVLGGIGSNVTLIARASELGIAMGPEPQRPQESILATCQATSEAQQGVKVRPAVLLVLQRHNARFETITERTVSFT